MHVGDLLVSASNFAGLGAGASDREVAISLTYSMQARSTIIRYSVGRQVAKAKTMLTAGQSVKVALWACGFETASAFATAFKRAVGMSSRDYAPDFKSPARRVPANARRRHLTVRNTMTTGGRKWGCECKVH
jgi:AraC-like DNA-binding protein